MLEEETRPIVEVGSARELRQIEGLVCESQSEFEEAWREFFPAR